MYVFPEGCIFFSLLSTLLVVRLFLCLELILKSIRALSLHLSLFIYEILIAELPTLCLDKLPFFFCITFIFKASLEQPSSALHLCRPGLYVSFLDGLISFILGKFFSVQNPNI